MTYNQRPHARAADSTAGADPILQSGLSGLLARARFKGCRIKAIILREKIMVLPGSYSDATSCYDAGISSCCFFGFFLAAAAMPEATTGRPSSDIFRLVSARCPSLTAITKTIVRQITKPDRRLDVRFGVASCLLANVVGR